MTTEDILQQLEEAERDYTISLRILKKSPFPFYNFFSIGLQRKKSELNRLGTNYGFCKYFEYPTANREVVNELFKDRNYLLYDIEYFNYWYEKPIECKTTNQTILPIKQRLENIQKTISRLKNGK